MPAVGGSSTASAPSARLFQPAGSKAVRLGLGVAIAAVMAGDVYAVLRSPVSEGRGAGSASASVAGIEDGSGAVVGRFGDGGTVAMNPFSDSAYGASLGLDSGAGAVVARGTTPVVTVTPVAVATLPSAPVMTPSPTIVLPAPTSGPSLTMPTSPTSSGDPADPHDPPPAETPAPAGLLAPVAEAVQTVPVVGDTVAPIVNEVDSQLAPVSEPVANAVQPVVAPVTTSLPGL